MTAFKDRGVPLTALAMTAGRAVGTSRADPLIKDPFAAALVEAAHSHVDRLAWPPGDADRLKLLDIAEIVDLF